MVMVMNNILGDNLMLNHSNSTNKVVCRCSERKDYSIEFGDAENVAAALDDSCYSYYVIIVDCR